MRMRGTTRPPGPGSRHPDPARVQRVCRGRTAYCIHVHIMPPKDAPEAQGARRLGSIHLYAV
eukprot:scaffold14713_cov131-Isochrysis_galbana.AAC.5